MKKLYYDHNLLEIIHATDMDEACDEIVSDAMECPVEVVEYEISKKSGLRWCPLLQDFEPECGKDCESYRPRNGKSGICKELRWSLHPTGSRYIVTNAEAYEYHLMEQ
jgi:hypothetical protein